MRQPKNGLQLVGVCRSQVLVASRGWEELLDSAGRGPETYAKPS